MREAVDQLIELIQFAGVAVAFVGVVVTVVRAAMVSVSSGGRSQRLTTIGLDLARTVLVGIDLLLVAAILEVAIAVDEVSFTRLATVAGLRIGLTLLIAFEDAFRADTAERPGGPRPWSKALGRAREVRTPNRVVAERPADNLWPDRARLGREWHTGERNARRSVG